MKEFDELTQEELASLDDEEIEHYVQVQMMKEGVVQAALPLIPTLEDAGIKKVTVGYKVADTIFKYREDAEKVAEMEMYKSNYSYTKGGWDYSWLEPLTDTSVTEERRYKQEDVERVAGILKAIKKAKDVYNVAKTAWDKANTAIEGIRDEITDAVREAQRHAWAVAEARSQYEHYITLSNGDEAVARNFFRQNFPADVVAEVLGFIV